MTKLFSTYLLKALLLILTVGFASCKDLLVDGPAQGKPINPPAVKVSLDSIVIDASDDDDAGGGGPRHEIVLSTRAPYLNNADSSSVSIDTSTAVPRLQMKLNVSPVYSNASEAKDARLKVVQIVLDSVPVNGDNWIPLHSGQVKFLVKVADKPALRYAWVSLVQPNPGPYYKDDTFASVIMWKVTARREIVLKFESQITYAVQYQGRSSRDRSRLSGLFRFRY